MSRKTIIAGNWKMNKTAGEARELARELSAAVEKLSEKDLPHIVLCPTFTSLPAVTTTLTGNKKLAVGAQNMDYRDNGAFTGEISAPMLLDLGVQYILIGHSERRQFFGETDLTVNHKLKAALKHKLAPIVCVGESLDEREGNLTDKVVAKQVAGALQDIAEQELESLIIAYEPVWAIGTGKSCDAEEANRVCGLIRTTINEYYKSSGKPGDKVPVLYGGSVTPANCEEQLAKPNIDGSLVGGASLKAGDFAAIIEAGAKRVARTPQVV